MPLSATLMMRAYKQRTILAGTDRRRISRFWFRHGTWFFILHTGYSVIGLLTVGDVENDWSSLFIIVFLVGTPLILVYRSFDSLRAERRSAASR